MTSTPFSSPIEEPRRRTSRPGHRARLLPLLAPILAVLLWPAGAPAQTAGAELAGRPLTLGEGPLLTQAEPGDAGGGEPFLSEEEPLPDDEPFLSEDEPFLSEAEPFLSEEQAAAEGDPDGDDQPFLSERDEPSLAADGGEVFSREKLFFRHRYRGLGGVNETRGIFFFFTGKTVLRELRLLNSYQQTIRIEESPTNYKFVKFSIDFTQNYDTESEQFFDSYFVFNEIYLNVRDGEDRLRWGNQIFDLGRVDFDSPIDVLHFRNIIGFLTFDTETSKESVPSFRYDRFGTDQRFSFMLAPIAQRTFGMRFTDFRDDAQARDAGRQPDDNSFLRDYAGLQYQWLGSSYDVRIGAFHWFDTNSKIAWRFRGEQSGADGSSFEDLIDSFKEEERQVNFLTFELDASFATIGWKTDVGFFDKKNFYSYIQTPDGSVNFSTVRVPHIGVATSFEKTFPFFFMLIVYSYRKLIDVPADTHVLLYENEPTPIGRKRDLEKSSLTGVFKWLVGANHNLTLALNRTAPFQQSTVFGIWAWQRPQFNSEWALKLLRFETETLEMTGKPIESTQAFITYTRRFSGT
ncbi:MAG: hypothetical protein O7A67_01870 [SAR324 cluster bacterium]|nr:hypothetical protein [SAR324 cluster bacterium]